MQGHREPEGSRVLYTSTYHHSFRRRDYSGANYLPRKQSIPGIFKLISFENLAMHMRILTEDRRISTSFLSLQASASGGKVVSKNKSTPH